MDHSNTTPDDPTGESELYALGALSAREAAEFEARLLAGEVDAEELDLHLRTMTELCEDIASPMPAPRRALKDAVMAAILPSEPKEIAESGQIFVLAGQGEWQEMTPGIRIKLLYADPNGERSTVLVRIDPGAAYPPHRHRGLEECLVLEGDLHVDGTVLRPGDYTASFEEKVHIDTYSEEGCLLLISSPLNDQFLGEQGHDH